MTPNIHKKLQVLLDHCLQFFFGLFAPMACLQFLKQSADSNRRGLLFKSSEHHTIWQFEWPWLGRQRSVQWTSCGQHAPRQAVGLSACEGQPRPSLQLCTHYELLAPKRSCQHLQSPGYERGRVKGHGSRNNTTIRKKIAQDLRHIKGNLSSA